MPAKEPIKIGVVGLGRAGYGIHIKRVREDDRFQITAVTDRIPERMQEVHDEFGSAIYPDHKTLARESDAEVIVVATFSDTHVSVSKDVLKAGRHCICEKPISDSYQAARGLIETAKKQRKKLFVHQNYRFHLEARHLLDVIKSKRIGDVFEIRMRSLSFSRRNDWQTMSERDGGVLNNTCPHFIDLGLQFLGSPVKDIFCDLKQIASAGDVEDHVKVLLKSENGRVYDMEVSSACAFAEPKWTVLGSRGTLISDGKTSTIRWFDPRKLKKLPVIEEPSPDRSYGNDDVIEWQTEEVPSVGPSIGDFYDNVWAVLRERKALVVKPEEALEVVRVTQACKRVSGFYD
jgi:scyllo-inositol 2-dehydrogenase (NADP+)